MKSGIRLLGAAVLFAGGSFAHAVDTATTTDWPKYGGTYSNTSFSALKAINTTNVRKLAAAWHVNLDDGSTANDQQGAPIVVNGVMYVHSAAGNVTALDGKTGAVIWRVTGLGTSRGVAVGQGLVFVPTRSPQVVTALDQATGAVVWTKTAADLTAMGANTDVINGTPQTFGGGGAPGPLVYYNGLVYVGTNGGDSAYRGRGFALNAADGSWKWTFWGTAAPGQRGGDTWEGTSWNQGGAAPWMHPAIDPDTNTLFWSWGNAFPNTNGSARGGDNLYASSITAVDATTGAYKWHFQYAHHDLWDYDLSPGPMLYDTTVNGQSRRAVAIHAKSGYLYILDRDTGQPLIGIDETPVGQNAQNKTAATQPIPRGDPFTPQCPDDPNFPATKVPPGYDKSCTFVPYFDRPGVHPNGTGGGGDWGSAVYDFRTNHIFVPAGIVQSGFSQSLNFFRPLGQMRSGTITAMDGATNKIVWQKQTQWSLAHNHLLGTAGDVLFVGQPDGYLVAMDSRNGNEMWRFQTGAGVHGAIISYMIDGEQYIAVLAGGNGLPYSSPRGDHLWAFRLNTFGKGVPPAPTPPAPSMRQPITATAVAGATVANTVLLARTSATSTENAGSNSMFPQNMTVPVGTTVTFANKADSTRNHCAIQFFEGAFSIGPLAPGQSGTYTFTAPGEYYYNDGCDNFQPNTTGKIVVQ
jgi:glucose dehydrogenase/plastocyanin